MIDHFFPRHKPWLKDDCTWSMQRGGREVSSWTDYIMDTYSHLLQNEAVQDVQHNTEYYLVLGCLSGAKPATHLRYQGKRVHFPIRTPAPPGKVDRMFAKIQGAIPSPPRQERHHTDWISPDTWILIDTRMEAHLQGDQRNSSDLIRSIKTSNHGDRCRREAEAGSEVESLLASNSPRIRESWI